MVMVAACGPLAPHGTAASSVRTASAQRSPETTLPSVPSAEATLAAEGGQIAGHVSFPAGVLPAQTVYAIATDNSRYYTAETAWGQNQYAMVGVAPGAYYVLSAAPLFLGGVPPGEPVSSDARTGPVLRFKTAYTRSVQCGLDVSCTDHTLVPVRVISGQTSGAIDPTDWYAPIGTVFPLIPNPGAVLGRPGVPDRSNLNNPTFPDATSAARYLAAAATSSRYVTSPASCPSNIACVWITGDRSGSSASYFLVQAGSNGITQTCALYLVQARAGWQQLGGVVWSAQCDLNGQPFPVVGGHGRLTMPMDESGCIRVHAAPSLAAPVVGCLVVGTAIGLDDGPVYSPAASPRPQTDIEFTLDYWWHVTGRGWVVHTYVYTYHYG